MKQRRKVKPYTHLTPKEWVGIKAMLDSGFELGKIVHVSGRSYQTLDSVKKSTSFGDYRAIVHAINARNKEKNGSTVAQQMPIPQVTEQAEPTLRDVYTLLKEIRDSLAKKKILL